MTEPENRHGTRHSHDDEWIDTTPEVPRLGRRESEPHSLAISVLYDIIKTNFPKDRGFWDLHHYFKIHGEEYDIQFDISYFKDFECTELLPSFKSWEFNNRIPTMAINILSKSTYLKDLSLNLDVCRKIGIPIYVVFFAYPVAPKYYPIPYLRVYRLENGNYHQYEIQQAAIANDGKLNVKGLISFPDLLPFKLGLVQERDTYQGAKPVFMLRFFNEDNHMLLTRADEEKQRADEAEKKVKELETLLGKYESE